MKEIRSCCLTRLLAGLVALLVAGGVAAAQGQAPSLERIFEGWKKRQQRVQRIRYTVVGESIVPKGSISFREDPNGTSPDDPPRDVPQEQNVTFLLDMARQRFRMELEGSVYLAAAKALSPRLSIVTFDGRDMMTAAPRDRNTSSVYVPGPLQPDMGALRKYGKYHPLKVIVGYNQAPLLFAHGFVPQLAFPPDFGKPPDADDFIVRGQVTRDRRVYAIVKTFPLHNGDQTSWDEYWVDTERDCAVVRQLSYLNDRPIIDLEITYQETKHGWLPQRWTATTRNQGTRDVVINVTRQRVKEFVADPAATDADYRLEARPGMIVWEDDFDAPKDEQTGPGFRRKNFRVAEDGSWKEIAGSGDQRADQQQSWVRRHWLALTLGLLAALLLGAGGLWVARRKRRRPPTLPAASPA